jgi:hypothetical protein
MRMGLKHCLVFFLTVSFCCAGCSSSVKVIRLTPAEVDLTAYKKIAVVNLSGEAGKEIAPQLRRSLASSGGFEVAGGQSLESMVREQGLSDSGPLDPAAAARLGREAGASALVLCAVSRRHYETAQAMYSATCNSNSRTYDCPGYRLIGRWIMDVQLSVTEASSGKALFFRSYNKAVQEDARSTAGPPDASWSLEEGFMAISEGIAGDFTKRISPWAVPAQVTLYESGALPSLEAGVSAARQGSWTLAVEHFKQACSTADGSPGVPARDRARAHYDLGVALGYSGTSYDQAVSEIQKAVDIMAEDVFYEEIGKIRTFKAEAAKMKVPDAIPGRGGQGSGQ